MTELRTTKFHALDTSRLQNSQLAGVVRPGVYSGFKVRPNSAESWKLDITSGNDSSSILVTSEGVKIEITEDLYGVVAIQNADPNLTRIDMVVAEYQYSTSELVDTQFKVIRGTYPVSSSGTPSAPAVQNAYQVPLALITVRPRSLGGSPRANVEITDVIHVHEAIDPQAPLNISSLMPIVAPADSRRIFVHAGILPSFDGTSKIDFEGGYSDIQSTDDLTEGDVRYYMFGVDDDGDVVVIDSAETVAELASFTRDIFPVCIVKGTVQSDAVRFSNLTDLRFPFARHLDVSDEAGPYISSLADSVFNNLRVELFQNIAGIQEDTLSDEDVIMEIDRGTTSLNFSADSVPADEVMVVTKDMLRETAINSVEHFMMVVDANFEGLEMRFSTTSPYSGFVSARVKANSIVRIPVGGGSQLFVQFIIPVSAFEDVGTPKIYSYGCYMVLDENVVNSNTISDVGIDSLKNSVPNLIANGNFRHWSRDDVNGNPTDVDAQVEIGYALSEDTPFAADGWQFTQLAFSSASGQIKRVGLSKDILQTGQDNVNDTALYWEGVGGSVGALGTNIMEYRVPVPPGSEGRRVTFSTRFSVSSISVLQVGIALYELTPQKTLRLQGSATVVAASVTSGDVSVISDLAINERTFAIGFLVYLNQGTGTTTAALWNARAAIGEFRSLPYNEAVNATDLLRKYYERGKAYISNNVVEGQEVGIGVQFGAKKFTGLGDLEAQTIPESDSNRSLNVNTPVYDVTPDGLVVTAQAVSSGVARIDVDFESFIRYVAVL